MQIKQDLLFPILLGSINASLPLPVKPEILPQHNDPDYNRKKARRKMAKRSRRRNRGAA